MTDKPTRMSAHTNLPILFPSPALTPQGCVTDSQLLTLFNAGFIAQLKVDGVRLRIHVTVHSDGMIKVHSIRTRSGDPVSPNLEVAIILLLSPMEPRDIPVGKEDQDYLIEAEFLYGGDMQKTAGRVHSTRLDIALSECQLYLFDCIRRDPDNQMYWLTSESYLVRYGYLAQFTDLNELPQQVFRLPILSKADQSDGSTTMEPIEWAQSLASSYGIEFEGVVLKDPSAPYTSGRSPNIQRWKQQAEHQAQVLDVEEMITFDLKPTGMVGSFKCLDISTGIEFSLSASSLPHSLRRAVWEHRDTFMPPDGSSGADSSDGVDRPTKPTILTYTALAFGVKTAPRMPRVVKSDIIKHLTKIGALPNE